MKRNKITLIIAIVFLSISLVIFLKVKTDYNYKQALQAQNSEASQAEKTKTELQTELLEVQEYDIVEGSDSAAITIIEYASYSCSHCATFYKNLYPQIKETYIDTNKVKFIFRDYPLDEPSLKASQLVHCLVSGKKKLMKVLFENQSVWAFNKNFPEKLENFAKIQGMNSDKFYQCMANESLEEEILKKRMKAFEAYNINSTPSLIINGQLYIGQKNWYELSEYLNNLLGS